MNRQPRILRTDTGYQYGNLHASGLTPRESQVLLMRAQGLQMKQCAHQLDCSVTNIRKLLSALFYKLRATSSTELVTKAFERGNLKFLSILFFIGLCLSGSIMADNPNSMMRTGRGRTTTIRIQRSSRKEGSGSQELT